MSLDASRVHIPRRTGAAAGVVLSAAIVASLWVAVPRAALARPDSINARQSTTDPTQTDCVADGQASAFPNLLLLGETTTVTLSLRAACSSGWPRPLHIVLVLDGSASTAGATQMQMVDVARTLVDHLNLNSYPETRVGVVTFETRARTRCRLTSDPRALKACILQVGASGEATVDAGLREGLRLLSDERRRVADRDNLSKVMIVFSNGSSAAGCHPVAAQARQVRAHGVEIVAVCAGSDCDRACMRAAASRDDFVLEFTNQGALLAILERFRDTPGSQQLDTPLSRVRWTVVDTLAPGMAYVPGSASPIGAANAAGNQVMWTPDQLGPIPVEGGFALTFRVRPLRRGVVPVSLEATAQFVDEHGRTGVVVFPATYVTVLEPRRQPTPAP